MRPCPRGTVQRSYSASIATLYSGVSVRRGSFWPPGPLGACRLRGSTGTGSADAVVRTPLIAAIVFR